jgi:thiol-disulfide isomerase/thioredoxin
MYPPSPAAQCGPCRRFTPKLVRIYDELMATAAVGSRREMEVVLVSWDDVQRDRQSYVDESGMRWLALPHEARKLVHELTLRYDVTHIPTLVVLEVSEDGHEARVLSRDGRNDIEGLFARGGGREEEATIAPWLMRALSGSVGGEESPSARA